MPIDVHEVETQVDVEAPNAEHQAPRPDALPRWQEIARRDALLAERTAAWGFDD
jgi:hypothetical protein